MTVGVDERAEVRWKEKERESVCVSTTQDKDIVAIRRGQSAERYPQSEDYNFIGRKIWSREKNLTEQCLTSPNNSLFIYNRESITFQENLRTF